MDVLWSPWRYQYVSAERPADGCVFCRIAAETERDAGNLVLGRARENYLVLNRFPYSTAHLMVVPYAHVPDLGTTPESTLAEAVLLAQKAERILREVYRPEGMNVGWNLGQCAGAGVAQHQHLHLVPRWPGDANFITTIGETRVIPEALKETHRRLAPYFAHLAASA
ncbi:MAG: HIT domain-containing protein [Bryobacterales bacterium]|nr:HIT domain-containing protein [Bryobacterales bacterium]